MKIRKYFIISCFTLLILSLLILPVSAQHEVAQSGNTSGHTETSEHQMPSLFWILPFVFILLAIALFPLIHKTQHWWEHNRNKLLVSIILGMITILYYFFRGSGFHGTESGLPAVASVLHHAVIADYIPFIVLLFSLYTISGGINLKGDIPAHPATNTLFLSIGSVLASLIGTTGAAMLLIRPILQINVERHHVKHTIIFFIFLVANIGGSLLPIGDPPLFLGYLRGVPFLWTLSLVKEWAFCTLFLLMLYYIWDSILYRKEEKRDIIMDELYRQPLKLSGKRNFLYLLGVVFAVAFLVPGKTFPGTNWVIPNIFLREIVQLILVFLALKTTPKEIREANSFNFVAIGEVAALFIGIFITMQIPIEILQIMGPQLGLHHPVHFFWASGSLSSFLDNAPTYVVFFETAGSLPIEGSQIMQHVMTATRQISIPLLTAISCGAVFMGANTYIGNGPNFMVKSIAEQSGVKMPSFFGYMLYSGLILIPLFILLTFVFFI